MPVARSRGIKFHENKAGVLNPGQGEVIRALRVLEEVALELGYGNYCEYNHACVKSPEEVRRRLDAL